MAQDRNTITLMSLTGAQISGFTRDQTLEYLGIVMVLTPEQSDLCQIPIKLLRYHLDYHDLQ